MKMNKNCKAIALVALLIYPFAPALATPDQQQKTASNIQRFVVRSDTQYPRTKDSNNDPIESIRLLDAQNAAINNWRNKFTGTIPIFLNGDITEFGRGYQWSVMKSYLAHMSPTYFGLGNHDYANNVSKCANNGCARDSLNFLYEKMGDWNVDAKDVNYSQQRYTGSYSYSKTIGDITFIQLNNHYNYSVSFSTGIGTQTYYDITNSLGWLEGEMERATNNGKLIVINMHRRPGDIKHGSAADREKFYALIRKFKALVVFNGHTHLAGKKTGIGITPVLDSGASFMKTFIVAEVDQSNNTFTTYLATDNRVSDVPLERVNIQMLPPAPQFTFRTQPDGKAIVASTIYDNTPRDKKLSSIELSLNNGPYERIENGNNIFTRYNLSPETTYSYRIKIYTTDPNTVDRTDSGTFTTPKLQQIPQNLCVDHLDDNAITLKWQNPSPNFTMPYYIQVETSQAGHPAWVVRSIAHDNRSTQQPIYYRSANRDAFKMSYRVYYWSAKEGFSPSATLEGKDIFLSGCQY